VIVGAEDAGNWLGIRRQLLVAALSPFVRQKLGFFISTGGDPIPQRRPCTREDRDHCLTQAPGAPRAQRRHGRRTLRADRLRAAPDGCRQGAQSDTRVVRPRRRSCCLNRHCHGARPRAGQQAPAPLGCFAGLYCMRPPMRCCPFCCPTSRDTRLIGQHNTLVYRANGETGATGLEPATSGVRGRRSNQLNYAPAGGGQCSRAANTPV
jgi:hypothetical protein